MKLHSKSTIKATLQNYMNDYTIQLVMDQFFPEMEELLDIHFDFPVYNLSAYENRTRLEDGISRWFHAVCSLNGSFPLVFILDDIQWASESTHLLKKILCNSDIHCLFILTHRPISNQSSIILDLFKEVESSELLTSKIILHGFKIKHTKRLVHEMMGIINDQFDISKLNIILQNSTEGNPFFVIWVSFSFVIKGFYQLFNIS